MGIDTQRLLDEREKNYGDFAQVAQISRGLKSVTQGTNGYGRMNNAQKEALDFIFNKIARLLSGDPNHKDSWDDIAGYAALGAKEIDG